MLPRFSIGSRGSFAAILEVPASGSGIPAKLAQLDWPVLEVPQHSVVRDIAVDMYRPGSLFNVCGASDTLIHRHPGHDGAASDEDGHLAERDLSADEAGTCEGLIGRQVVPLPGWQIEPAADRLVGVVEDWYHE